ncbi:hypothetical protein ACS0TY_032785 [Phlomoides rotata]
MKSKFIVLSIFPENERRKGDHPTEIRWRGNGEQNVELIYKKGNNSSSNLCLSSSLDPTAVRGKVVVCDRGIQREGAGSRWRRDDSGEHGGEVGRELVAVGQKTGDLIRQYVKIENNPTTVVNEELAMDSSYKKEMPFFLRRTDATDVLQKNPDKIPVILENAWKSQLPDLDKNMYLVPNVWTVRTFVSLIQGKLKLTTAVGKPIFLFVKNMLLPTDTFLSDIYEEHKDADGFLYMTYSGESW